MNTNIWFSCSYCRKKWIERINEINIALEELKENIEVIERK